MIRTLFVFRKDGTYIDEIRSDDNFESHPILKGIVGQPLLLRREKQEHLPDGSARFIMYHEEQLPESPRYLEAMIEMLRKRKFEIYVFSEEKSRIARLLLSTELKSKDNIRFFDMLVVSPSSAVKELERGLKEDVGIAAKNSS